MSITLLLRSTNPCSGCKLERRHYWENECHGCKCSMIIKPAKQDLYELRDDLKEIENKVIQWDMIQLAIDKSIEFIESFNANDDLIHMNEYDIKRLKDILEMHDARGSKKYNKHSLLYRKTKSKMR